MKSEKALIIYSFLACLFLMIVGVFSAATTNQLLASFIYLPLVFFFGTKIFHLLNIPTNKNNDTVSTAKELNSDTEKTEILISDPAVGIKDTNKRLFLQLIGTTGISLLLLSLFSRRARDTFLGGGSTPPPEIVSIKDIAGNPINPAEKEPTDGYVISDIDDSSSPSYYSFVKKDGAWYIMQNSNGNFRYSKGDSNYQSSWEARSKLHYDYYNNIFNS